MATFWPSAKLIAGDAAGDLGAGGSPIRWSAASRPRWIWRWAVPMRTAAASTGMAKPAGGPPAALLEGRRLRQHHELPVRPAGGCGEDQDDDDGEDVAQHGIHRNSGPELRRVRRVELNGSVQYI